MSNISQAIQYVLRASSSQTTSRWRPSYTHLFKVILIGDSIVGKTCLLHRFHSGKFLDDVEITVGLDLCIKTMEVDGEKIKLQLWDTAGVERFRSINESFYRTASGAVFVYDVTNPQSFYNIQSWIEECRQHSLDHGVVHVLVGNKCDLHHAVRVSTEVAQQFADAHSMPLFEVSAKSPETGRNDIEDIFMTLAHKLKSQKSLVLSQRANTVTLSGQEPGTGWGCSTMRCWRR